MATLSLHCENDYASVQQQLLRLEKAEISNKGFSIGFRSFPELLPALSKF